MSNSPVDAAAFAVFDTQELSVDSFGAGLAEARDDLPWCFSGARLLQLRNRQEGDADAAGRDSCARPQMIHGNVYEHRELGRRLLHGVRTRFFFYRGKQLGWTTGWHGVGQFEAPVAAAREKIRTANAAGSAQVDGTNSGKSSTD